MKVMGLSSNKESFNIRWGGIGLSDIRFEVIKKKSAPQQ